MRKCPYCDFNSHVSETIPEQAYLDKLVEDFEYDLAYVQDRSVQSIFFGGGTPSMMSGEFYQSLLRKIGERVAFADDIEITLEANPGTTEASRFEAYAEAGINRLSLGVQSFNDRHLEALGRIHSADEAAKAIEQAHSAGLYNCNIDLMHGLPGQTLEEALSDIDTALALGPKHLSWYQLTIEQNTEFYRYPPKLPEDEALWDIQQKGAEKLAQNGFAQYEVSAFTLEGRQAKHNLNYWRFGDYIGLGAGAHSKITLANASKNEFDILRYRKTRIPKDYLNGIASDGVGLRLGVLNIAEEDLGFEFLMNILRLTNGGEEDLLMQRTGLQLSAFEPLLSEFKKQGLMKQEGLCTTDKGLLFLNSILEKFAQR